jgi:hypothetical protein
MVEDYFLHKLTASKDSIYFPPSQQTESQALSISRKGEKLYDEFDKPLFDEYQHSKNDDHIIS